jgi:putative DNA primase/helicase
MHVVCAPAAGSGKSYLIDIAASIALGQPAPVISVGKTEEEAEKRLGAALLSGQSIISLDNVNGDLGGDALCQIVERPLVQVRVLGKSELVTVESRSTIFATGNNIRLTGDMTRRAIQAVLDADKERPELRSFSKNPVDMVLANRGKYVAAILTIIRAYIVAGKPEPMRPSLPSFEEWSDLLRSALVWLGEADPLATMDKVREQDPDRQEAAGVFMAVWAITKGQPFTSKGIHELAIEKDSSDTWSDQYIHPELRDALMNAMHFYRNEPSPKDIGKWLGRHKGRICNGLKLCQKVDGHGHAATWWVEKSGSAVESGSILTLGGSEGEIETD